MDRTDYDRITALADQRAAAADIAADELRRVGDDLLAIGAGFVGLKRVADQLTAVAEADRQLAAIFRRLALAARQPPPPPPEPEPEPSSRPADTDDWRAWTEDTFAEAEPEAKAEAEPERTGRGRGRDRAEANDWDDTPLIADVRFVRRPEPE